MLIRINSAVIRAGRSGRFGRRAEWSDQGPGDGHEQRGRPQLPIQNRAAGSTPRRFGQRLGAIDVAVYLFADGTAGTTADGAPGPRPEMEGPGHLTRAPTDINHDAPLCSDQ